MLLAIDTSTRYAGIALADDRGVIDLQAWHSTVNHTSELMPAVANLLGRRGLKPASLDAVAVALGPGGFSSLRVGVSAAKGMTLAGRLPLLGVGTLDLEAHPCAESGKLVCPMLDAGRGEVASALMGADGVRVREDTICLPGDLGDLMDSVSGVTLYCGEGVGPHADLIKERMGPKAVVINWSGPASRLNALVEIARQRLELGDQDDLATLQPYYLRMPSIGAPKQRGRAPQGRQ